MKTGLIDADMMCPKRANGIRYEDVFPNLVLMKLSGWQKMNGDSVECYNDKLKQKSDMVDLKIILTEDTLCAHDVHETTYYPRDWFKSKPKLKVGTILHVKDIWNNFYGQYYKCDIPEGIDVTGCTINYEYDIPVQKAKIIN